MAVLRYFVLAGLLVAPGGCQEEDDTAGDCEGDYEIMSESDLDTIGQCESISGYLRIYDQPWLAGVELPVLTTVGTSLHIEFNDALTSLDMPALTTVGTTLGIRYNPVLTSLEFDNITSVGGLHIAANDVLADIDGLSGITTLGSSLLYVVDNPALTSVDLRHITDVNDDMAIRNNDALTSLNGLSNITSVAGDLEIKDDDALTGLTDLSNLTTVGGDLVIWDNDCISWQEAQAFAAGLSVGGTVSVEFNGDNYPCE